MRRPTADLHPYLRDRAKVIPARRDWIGIRGWRHRVNWAVRRFYVARPAIRIAVIAVTALLGLTTFNLVYHVLRKPTEMFAFISGEFDKAPADTWRDYGSLFREYSTATISPELLAALAQVEGAGNPVARTYWRWQLSWNPLALYRLPSTLVVGQTPEIPVREFSNRPSSRIMQIQPRRAHELAHRTPLLRGGNAPPREGTKGLIG